MKVCDPFQGLSIRFFRVERCLWSRCQLGSYPLCRVSTSQNNNLVPLWRLCWREHSGYTPLPASTISPASVSVSFIPSSSCSDPTPLRLLTNGEPEPNIDESRATEILKEEDLEVEIDLGAGEEEARVWTCDFSHVSFFNLDLGWYWFLMGMDLSWWRIRNTWLLMAVWVFFSTWNIEKSDWFDAVPNINHQ